MIILRRIVLMLSAFLLLAFVTVVLLAPDAVRNFADSISDTALIVRLLLIILLYAGVLGFAYWQFRNLEHGDKGLVVRSQGANMSLTVESARERILETIRGVRGVRSVEAEIKPVRGRADIHLKVTVASSDTNLIDEQKHITRALEQVVKKQLGLRMAGRPNVELNLGGVAAEGGTTKTPAASMPEPVPAKPVDEKKSGQGGVLGGLFGKKKDEESSVKKADAAQAEDSSAGAIPAAGKLDAAKAAGEDDLSEDDFFAMLESTIPEDGSDDSSTSAEIGQQTAPTSEVDDDGEEDGEDAAATSTVVKDEIGGFDAVVSDADDDMIWLDKSADENVDPDDGIASDSDDDEARAKDVGSAWE
jgi:hypothetical protein